MRTLAGLFVCIVLFALTAPGAAAQEPAGDRGLIEIRADKDLGLADFLDQVSQATGQAILYDPNSQRIRGQKIGIGFTHKVPKVRAFDTCRAILAFYELFLVPVGPKGFELYLCLDSRSTNNFVKNKATFVNYEDLARYEDRDGIYISCAIPVKHIENLTTMRTALSTMVSPAGIGRVMEVTDSSALVVMDFAPTVVAIAKLVRQMDVEPRHQQRKLGLIPLQHGAAEEIAAVINALMKPAVGPTPASASRRPVQRNQPIEPRVVAYARLNALAVAATPEDYKVIQELVNELDQPPRKE